jgi:hypothetical protein
LRQNGIPTTESRETVEEGNAKDRAKGDLRAQGVRALAEFQGLLDESVQNVEPERLGKIVVGPVARGFDRGFE